MSIRHTEGRLVMSMEVEVAPEDDFLTSPLGPVAFRAAGTLGLSVEAAVYPIAIIMGGGGWGGERWGAGTGEGERDDGGVGGNRRGRKR